MTAKIGYQSFLFVIVETLTTAWRMIPSRTKSPPAEVYRPSDSNILSHKKSYLIRKTRFFNNLHPGLSNSNDFYKNQEAYTV